MNEEENGELWKWFEEKFGKGAMERYYGYEVNELIKEAKRYAKCKKIEKIEERLEKIEKKIEWLIDYIGFGLYQREIIIKPSAGTEEEKELIKYYKEPATTDGRG